MAKPKFSPFDRVGRLMIRSHVGFTAINRRNGRTMAKEQHWYDCRCACGAHVQMPQQELVDKRRTHLHQCPACRSPEQDNTPDSFSLMARKIAMEA